MEAAPHIFEFDSVQGGLLLGYMAMIRHCQLVHKRRFHPSVISQTSRRSASPANFRASSTKFVKAWYLLYHPFLFLAGACSYAKSSMHYVLQL
jgi:hypothetical protein